MCIQATHLACGYGGRVIIDDINMQIEKGEITCILGPNGVGKTTFFKTIQGFLKPLTGSIQLDGQEISCWNRKNLAKKIAYVPQTQSQPFPFKVLDVVVMGRNVHLNNFSSPSQKDYKKCEEVMEQLGISSLNEKIYSQLSGGERQLVLIARALVQEPEMLMMDEPASNLDYGNQVRVLQQIKKLAQQNIGIIMITHSPEHAFACADKVALFTRNGGVRFGETAEIVTEDALREAYGVTVKIPEIVDDMGHKTRTCVPIM